MSITLTLDASFNVGALKAVTSSASGAYMYSLIDNDGVYRSTNLGVSWTKTYSAVTAQLTSITCSSDGSIVYFCWVGGGLFQSTDYGLNFNNLEFANLTAVDGGPYIRTVACDITGNKVIVSLQAGSTYVYISTNAATSWTAIQAVGASSYIFNVVCNSSATILYAIVGPSNGPSGASSNIYTSTNSGTTWTILPGSFTASWESITCNSTGTIVYAVAVGVGLYIFSPSTAAPVLITSPNTSSFGQLATYSNGTQLLTGSTTYTYNYTVNYPPPPPIMCFKEDSKILCLVEDNEVYVPIQDIRKGTLVKTRLQGYVPVNMIGHTKIYNEANYLRGKNRLYKCSTEKYPELTEDLVLTGCHSILVDSVTEEQRSQTVELIGYVYVTEQKYRLMTMFDERAEPLMEEGVFNIWHLALDHDDIYVNYGVYANGGLLVETTSQRMMKEFSGMNILE